MVDFIDEATSIIIASQEGLIEKARVEAMNIPKGEPGICRNCDEENGRIVNGLCSPCRDELKII